MRFLSAFALVLMLAVPASAQETVPAPAARPSPLMLAKTQLGTTYVKLHYGSPQRRHPQSGEIRTIFGGVVPFGQVWRTGANEATEITFTGDLMIGGSHVPAGTYALYTIPGETEWTVILSKAIGQWGSFSYDQAQDAARVTVPSGRSDKTYEAFTIAFEEAPGGAHLVMTWENTQVRVPIMAH